MAAFTEEALVKDAETRKASLQQRADGLQADLNAILGAIQDCDFWIAWFKGEIQKQQKEQADMGKAQVAPTLVLPEGVQIVGVEELPDGAATEDGGTA